MTGHIQEKYRKALEDTKIYLNGAGYGDPDSFERLMNIQDVLLSMGDQSITPATPWRPTHVHRKSGEKYCVLHVGLLEADLKPVVIYENRDHCVWVRPVSEFLDGRFVVLQQDNLAGV
ncbi:hypothetical protein [uncultured Cohaesibacter sp.]|uniref:hypothetical protein n=1 Tax=uncultured Cohaesibacter sp. TaxID=1002546 RepID=UPI0029C7854A|nr:hypothetical protein [uncultured Cohaesibacter sp.]